jgi:glycosyltransferase involved in cell wall biosynthesis
MPLSRGGLSDYAHEQANALVDLGVDVTVVCPPGFANGRRAKYTSKAILPESSSDHRNVLLRRADGARRMLSAGSILARYISKSAPHHVLTHFSEYLAPFWAPRLQRLRQRGFVFHTVLHDPQRTYQVGPAAFHRLSVRAAFDLNTTVFVHGNDRGDTPPDIPVVRIPHGVFEVVPPGDSRSAVRRRIGVPETARLVTAYGYIRDDKNLDLLIEAIGGFDDTWLLVAGSEIKGKNRPVAYYKALAERLGCADRVVFVTRFISNEEAADLLAASDLLALTYSAKFVSSSGVLALGVGYRVPSLISSGSAATRELVERYGIGIWVEPDNVDAIRDALRAARVNPPLPDWDGYCRDNSWVRNAEIVLGRMREAERASSTGAHDTIMQTRTG